jgi:hypothetical protein
MDSIRVSEAPDPSSILGEATRKRDIENNFNVPFLFWVRKFRSESYTQTPETCHIVVSLLPQLDILLPYFHHRHCIILCKEIFLCADEVVKFDTQALDHAASFINLRQPGE